MSKKNRILVMIGGFCAIVVAGYLASLGFKASTCGWFFAIGAFAFYEVI